MTLRHPDRLAACLRVLELQAVPTRATLQAAYRALCKRYHPDRFGGDPERTRLATELLVEVNAAYVYVRDRIG